MLLNILKAWMGNGEQVAESNDDTPAQRNSVDAEKDAGYDFEAFVRTISDSTLVPTLVSTRVCHYYIYQELKNIYNIYVHIYTHVFTLTPYPNLL